MICIGEHKYDLYDLFLYIYIYIYMMGNVHEHQKVSIKKELLWDPLNKK